MNKQQAADFLDVTTRAVERYVERGRLTARYVKGKTGKIADFDEAELRAPKEELDQPPNIIRPAVQRRSRDNHDGPDRRDSPERPEGEDSDDAERR